MTDTSPPRRGRPPLALDETTLLAAAVAAFGPDGHAASVDEVARRAGVTKPLLFRRFGTKDALMDWTVQREMALLTEHLFRAYDDGRHQPAHDALHSGVDAILTYAVDRPDGFRLLFGPTSSGPLRRVLTDRIEELAAERIGARPESCALVADVIVGACTAVAARCIERPDIDPKAASRFLADVLSAGLRHATA